MTRPERLTLLIGRMPKDVREEVERLDAEVLALKKQVDATLAEKSPVAWLEYGVEGGYKEWPIPVNKAVRFYDKNTSAKERDRSNSYLEVMHDRNQKPTEKGLIIEVRSGYGQLSIWPSSANGFYVRPRDF